MTQPKDASRQERPDERNDAGRAWIIVACALGFFFTLLVYQPGYMSYDSLDQLQQARRGEFIDNHPPLMAAIWSVVDRVCAGPFGMLLLQNLLFWSGLAVFFMYAPGRIWVRLLCAILIGLYPPIFGLIGTIWKDLLMLGALVLATGLINRFRTDRSVFTALAVAFLLVVASALRHNSMAAIPPLVLMLVLGARMVPNASRTKAFLVSMALSIPVSGLLMFGSTQLSDRLTHKRNHFWQAFAVYDLAGISVRTGEMLFPEGSPVLMQPADLDGVKAVYTGRSVGKLYQARSDRAGRGKRVFDYTHDDMELQRLRSSWVDAIIAHPGAYVAHRAAIFAQLVGLTSDPVDTPIYGLYGPRIIENDMGFVFVPSDLNENITDFLIDLSKTPIYRVWIYLLALFVFCAIGIHRFRRRGEYVVLCLSTSGLFLMLPYFFVAASGNFRYSLWGLMTALLCATYLLCEASARQRGGRLSGGDLRRGESKSNSSPRAERDGPPEQVVANVPAAGAPVSK